MRKKYAVTLFYPNLAVGLRLSTPVLLGYPTLLHKFSTIGCGKLFSLPQTFSYFVKGIKWFLL